MKHGDAVRGCGKGHIAPLQAWAGWGVSAEQTVSSQCWGSGKHGSRQGSHQGGHRGDTKVFTNVITEVTSSSAQLSDLRSSVPASGTLDPARPRHAVHACSGCESVKAPAWPIGVAAVE
jgi:hypothetical protein